MNNRVIALVLLASVAFPSAVQTQPESAGDDAEMRQMQERMQTMRDQMERIHATEDPQERSRLMSDHMKNMHEGMAMMGRMSRASETEDAQAPALQCREGDVECRMQHTQAQQGMMERRMDMLQQMMEQMMAHMMYGRDTNGANPANADHATPH